MVDKCESIVVIFFIVGLIHGGNVAERLHIALVLLLRDE